MSIALEPSPCQCCCSALVAQSCPTLCNPTDCSPPRSSVHGLPQARITGVGCHFLLQRAFLMQGSNPRLLHLLCWQVGSLPLSHLVITRSETTGFRPWRHIGVTWFLSKPHVPGARLITFYPVYFF